MKKFIFYVCFLMIGLNVMSQHTLSGEHRLAIKGGPVDRVFIFKPEKPLTIKTTSKKYFYLKQYLINPDHILTNADEIIYFQDIAMIKGRVMDNWDRVAPGILVFTTGAVLVFPLGFLGAWTSPQHMFLFASPAIAMVFGGIRMMGRRNFHMNRGWEIQIFPANE
jgi:hypothetical protein